MQTGIVKWFNSKKGFGFIQPEDGGADVFVHHTDIRAAGFRTLHAGERVAFELEISQKGSRARKVVRC